MGLYHHGVVAGSRTGSARRAVESRRQVTSRAQPLEDAVEHRESNSAMQVHCLWTLKGPRSHTPDPGSIDRRRRVIATVVD